MVSWDDLEDFARNDFLLWQQKSVCLFVLDILFGQRKIRRIFYHVLPLTQLFLVSSPGKDLIILMKGEVQRGNQSRGMSWTFSCNMFFAVRKQGIHAKETADRLFLPFCSYLVILFRIVLVFFFPPPDPLSFLYSSIPPSSILSFLHQAMLFLKLRVRDSLLYFYLVLFSHRKLSLVLFHVYFSCSSRLSFPLV